MFINERTGFCQREMFSCVYKSPLHTLLNFVHVLSVLRFSYLTLDQSCMFGMASNHCQVKESLPLLWHSNSMKNHLNHMAKTMTQFFPMVNLMAAMTKWTTRFHLEDHRGHCLRDSMKRQRRYCSGRNFLIGQIQPRLSE